METRIKETQKVETQRPFSLTIYLLIVFGLSWPFQIAYAVWGATPTASYLLSSISMVMVTVASFIAGRYIFRDGFKNAGWSWGNPKHYVWVFSLALFIFAVPTLLEPVLGLRILPVGVSVLAILGNFFTALHHHAHPWFWRGIWLARLHAAASRKAIHST